MNVAGYSDFSVLHEGAEHIVYRAVSEDGVPVIVKAPREEHPGDAIIRKLRQEYETITALDSEGVVRARELARRGSSLFLVLHDFGGTSLKALLGSKKLALREVLQLGIKICGALHDIHAAGIVHRDINPANIVYNQRSGELRIIDFGLAVSDDGQPANVDTGDRIEGTLGYMAPEQSGRMSRRVDWRSDLYSLGVIFYEMLTRRRPFESDDQQQLIYDHIARSPVPPQVIDRRIPAVLSAMVLKLLAKNADGRYQSAIGISADLRRCLATLSGDNAIEPFAIASQDVSERFVLPTRLYGRDAELARLQSLLEGICGGRREMLLVRGGPGIGKTSLVREMHNLVIARHGYFISSKFDQFVRSIPYSAIIGALQELVNQLLAEPRAKLEQWCERIVAALGPNSGMMVELIPDLELIIGPQPPVADLSPDAAQNRFRLVFYDFIALFCRREHPLVIFLDDLQWVDQPSLELIATMMSLDDGALLIICAYRDNEVDAGHPFIGLLQRIPDEQKNVLDLGPLDPSHIEDMVADMVHCPLVAIRPLCHLIEQKTRGNPFFVGEFLKTLHKERLLAFAVDTLSWQWDLAAIAAKGFTDNVVELVIDNLGRLPDQTRQLLGYAAMLGNVFDLEKLAMVSERPQEELLLDLRAALQEGFIVQQTRSRFAFSHDRIQQGAYNMIAPDEREAQHLRAGRLLLAACGEEKRDENLFVIVDQLNKGRRLLSETGERAHLARLNYQAGGKAKASAAYTSAWQFLAIGIELLPQDAWESEYDFTLAIHDQAAEAAYLMSDYTTMEGFGEVILAKARTIVDKVSFYITKIRALGNAAKNLEALDMGLRVLADLGVNIPRQPKKIHVMMAFMQVQFMARGLSPEEIAAFPEVRDPWLEALLRLADSLVAPVYAIAPQVLAILDFKMVALLARHRVSCPASRILWGVYGAVFLLGVMNKVERGSELMRLVGDLLTKRADARQSDAVIHFSYASFYLHRIGHLRSTFKLCHRAFRSGMENGDLLYSGLAITILQKAMFLAGVELAEIETTLTEHLPTLVRIKHEKAVYILRMRLQCIRSLQGRSEDPWRLQGEFMEEDEVLKLFQRRGDISFLFDFHLTRAMLCLLFGRHEEAREHATRLEKYREGQPGQVVTGYYHFLDSLVQLADTGGRTRGEIRLALKRVDRNQKVLKAWSKHAPMNNEHKIFLVEAERSRVLGDLVTARECYDRAIALAGKEQFLHEEALANELAGRFLLSTRKSVEAATYLREARYLYKRWGAAGKVAQLDGIYGELLVRRTGRGEPSVAEETVDTLSSTATARFDLNSVVKAAGAISREIRLDRLLAEMIKIIMENAGAQRGFLILNHKGRLRIEAQGSIESREEPEIRSVELEGSEQLCAAVVRYVERTLKTLVLADAAHQGNFTQDDYVRRTRPRSILCMPIMNKATLTGILYLENNLSPGAFTDQMVELLTILASQAAISIENARLYGELKTYQEHLEKLVGERTAALNLEIEERKRAQEEAVSANQAKSVFLANMSHEIRTPMNAILGFSQILQSDAGLNEKQRRQINTISRSGEHLLNIINDILEISKIEAGRMTFKPVVFDLYALLEDMEAIFCERAGQKGLRFSLSISPATPRLIRSDAGKLGQILINLLGNAVKFTHQGGIVLRVDALRESGRIRLCGEVEDSGEGISPEDMGKLFKQFQQAAAGIRSQEGTGLGLIISREFARMMGGDITATSVEGLGSCFRFAIIVDEVEEAEAWVGEEMGEVKALRPGCGPYRILVVDDDAVNRQLLREALDKPGFELLEAENGAEAVRLFGERRPHLVFMDIRMPVLGGIEAAREIRALPGGEEVPLIAVTASAFKHEEEMISQKGFNEFVTKPIKLNSLFMLIRKHLGAEYDYQSPLPRRQEGEARPAEPYDASLLLIPDELRQRMMSATISADIEKLVEALREMQQYNESAARDLLFLAERFDYEAILNILEQENPS